MLPKGIIEARNGVMVVLAKRWRHNERQLKRLARARRRADLWKEKS